MRITALLLASVVATSLPVPSAAPAPAGLDAVAGDQRLDWRAGLAAARGDDPVSPPVQATRSAPLELSQPAPPADRITLPPAGVSEVLLAEVPRQAGTAPVVFTAGSAAVGRRLRVAVLDHDAVARAGVSGFAFQVSGPDGAALGTDPLPVTVSIDYASFAERFGAGYADRLRLVALPSCSVASTIPRGCDLGGTTIPARNERDKRRIVTDTINLAAVELAANGPSAGSATPADRGALLAVTAGPEGEEGSFKATPLALSGDWQVTTGSGNFTYTHEVPLAAAPAGPTPQVAFNYSSAAVDGLVSGKNTQSGQVGLGWQNFADAFIERRYNSCLGDGQVHADLCWASDNATMSLNGKSGELVPLPNSTPQQWRLKNDPRWKVEQLTGADNGDDNGEHWKVTAPDGVQYFFGRGINPDVGQVTNSVWTVPVFGDDAGEPCNTTPALLCVQAWRWNLDLVIDPHDNVQQWEYTKEINHYAALNGWPSLEHTEYVRSGALKVIKYGKRRVGGETTPSARVDFTTAHRCIALDDTCRAPTAATAANYPDTPVDLMCFTATCAHHTPTFFTALRYSAITASVNDNGFVTVDTVRLLHGLPDPDPGRTGDQKLYLIGIQRTGHTGNPQITLPAVTFWPVLLNNRVDTAGGRSAMPHYRVGVVTNEYGGQVFVTYGQPHACPSPIPDPPNWDRNTRNCYPHWYSPEGGTPGFAVFHKYVVTQVTERDTVGGSPDMVTTYRYGDQVAAGLPNGAWHHDRDVFVPNSRQTWSEWRGYADVLVSQGATRTQYRLLRGMNADRLAGDPFPGPGSRRATLSSLDDTVTNINDENWLAGRVLDEASLRTNGTVESGMVRGYHTQRTIDAPGLDPLDDAWFVAEGDTTERKRNPADGGYVRRRSQTTYNLLLGFPERGIEHGWTHVSGDERCTLTTYAFNVDKWMFDFPAAVTRYANATCDGSEVTRQEYAYDGGAVGAPPTRGDRTSSRVKITTAPTWATTTTTYDRLGRPLNVTDPNGNTTKTVHTPDIRYPATTTVTNPRGHAKTIHWFRPRQAPLVETDARGKKTSRGYDALGRTITVHQPTEQAAGAPASYEFTYAIDPDKAKPAVARTRRLQDTAGGSPRYTDTWAVYDSWLRERQTHALSPESRKVIVVDTRHDDRGLVASKSRPEAVPGSPGQGLLPIPSGGWANDTTTAYDELRRPVWGIAWIRSVYRRSVVTEYTHDMVKTTPDPPAGGVVRTTKDAYDRTVMVEELDGVAWRPTGYGYDPADRLSSVRDPAGNTITNTYDMAGRKTVMTDPDAGRWTYEYDDAGNEIRVTSAAGVQLHTRYDPLNRKTERRKDSPSGALQATWAYDAAGEQGLLDRSTRIDATGAWVVDVTGYDDRARTTGTMWTVPAGIAGLSGSYTIRYGYDAADHQTKITYPAVGGLAAETVTTTYNSIGLADTMAGAEEYLWSANYDNRGRPTWLLSGSRSVPFSRLFDYDADQRIARLRASGGSTTVQDIQFSYDITTGNVTERNTMLNGQVWRECFDHDDRQRLTRAFTTNGTCAAGTPGTGTNPFNHSYTHSVDGNLTRRVEGATTINYTYPAPGAIRPHAPTAMGGNSYSWTANGDMASRTVNGQTETLTWNAERQLAHVDDPDGDSSFVYDANGTRLLRQTPNGKTLYIEDHEITAPSSGPATAVRTNAFNDTSTAIRTTGGVEYLATDNQGSVQLTVPTGATTPSKTRSYQPYGKPRTTDTTATDRGWIGQIEDKTTGLNYLNARYYDPTIARFVSPDPLFDPTNPQTINPYAYGLNNPAAYADPSGLQSCWGWECAVGGYDPPPQPPCWGWECQYSEAPPPGQAEFEIDEHALDDLRDAAGTTGDVVDVADAGLELCNRTSERCATIVKIVRSNSLVRTIVPGVGVIGVVLDCQVEGWTSDDCLKSIFWETIEQVPLAGDMVAVVRASDIDISRVPAAIKDAFLTLWHGFFSQEGPPPPPPNFDQEVADHYGEGPNSPTGGPHGNPNVDNCGVPVGGQPTYCEDESP